MLTLNNLFGLTLAQAQNGAEAQPGGLIGALLPFILIFVIMYMVLIRPQQKRNKQHQEMIKRLKAGDEIVTAGGLHGRITEVKVDSVIVKLAENVEVEVARPSVHTIKNQDSEESPEPKQQQSAKKN